MNEVPEPTIAVVLFAVVVPGVIGVMLDPVFPEKSQLFAAMSAPIVA